MRILLAEDDRSQAESIQSWLELDGYQVDWVERGDYALTAIEQHDYDCILLDRGLPQLAGEKVLTTIRHKQKNVPVIFITARDSIHDRVEGLDLGANDYLVKPFNLEELILRVGNLIRRGLKPEDLKELNSYSIGDKTIYFNSFELHHADGTITSLTKKETMLLKLLIERRNEAVSREQILETVWNYDVYPSTRTIDNFILTFRKYFEPDQKHPIYFHSIRGVGYKFTDNPNAS